MKAATVPKMRVVFITVDPARDPPNVVGLYVHAFDPSFIGVTGDEKTIDKVARDFGVAVNKVDLPGGDYTMDHSAVIFLVNTQGQVAGIFTPPFDAHRLAEDFSRAAPYLPKS
jgi:protein SCO1